MVVAVVVSTTFDFTLLQVPVVKSLNVKSNNRTSCSFTWNDKFKRKNRVKYIHVLYVSLKEQLRVQYCPAWGKGEVSIRAKWPTGQAQ